MKLSVITDEVSQNLDEVIAFCQHYHLDGVELRSVEGIGAFDFDRRLVQRMRDQFSSAGLEVCCLSLPFFKCDYRDLAARQQHLDSLKRSLENAHVLGARFVRGFCFWRQKEQPLAVSALQEAFIPVIPLLAESGVTMVLESDPSVNGHTASGLAGYLQAIDSQAVRALWDGGNLLFSPDGEDPLQAYDLLKSLIRHVHIKDAAIIDGAPDAVRVGTGQARVQDQLRMLVRDHYAGWISLETHYRLAKKLDEAALRLPGGASFSDGAAAASAESMESLILMLRQLNMIGA